MSIEVKAVFMHNIELELAVEIRFADMKKVLRILSKSLDNYDLIKTTAEIITDDLLDAYTSALEVGGRSAKTIERYRYILSKMMAAVNTPTRSITVYHLRKYLADEKERGISDRTLEGYRQVFSAFFSWLQRERLIDTNPCLNLSPIKYTKKQKDIYSDADFEKLKMNCETVRDRAIICFLQSTACRISEMTALNRGDVDLRTLECKVLGKGNKERIVYLNQVAGMMLKEYLDQRTDDCEALFIGKGTTRMTPHGIRKMLKNLGCDAEVDHVHPHKFRRTMATNLIKHGMPIQEVAAILGHDKLDTTMQYVVLDKTDIKYSYNKYA